jgi:hypothetical protein
MDDGGRVSAFASRRRLAETRIAARAQLSAVRRRVTRPWSRRGLKSFRRGSGRSERTRSHISVRGPKTAGFKEMKKNASNGRIVGGPYFARAVPWDATACGPAFEHGASMSSSTPLIAVQGTRSRLARRGALVCGAMFLGITLWKVLETIVNRTVSDLLEPFRNLLWRGTPEAGRRKVEIR